MLTFLHKGLALLFSHAFFVSSVDQTIYVSRAGAADEKTNTLVLSKQQREHSMHDKSDAILRTNKHCKFLSHNGPSQWNLVDLSSFVRVPASANQPSHQVVLIVIANCFHQICASFYFRQAINLRASDIEKYVSTI